MPSNFFLLASIGVLLLFLATPAAAFGAGNIISVSQVAGKNWRHGDIEDTLLELFMSAAGRKKFDRLAVKRVYFGNWLRDYSQAIDVGALKQLPKETIRIMLWVISFMTFGFATGEFEVTEERLGCYRPEEHIDNPRGYADGEDARTYDSRLRGPVDEKKEIRVDPRNAMKNYIASEDKGIDTSAALVRNKLSAAIEKGRQYGRDGRSEDLYEALRLLGTGLHCLEDFAAHSNYIELALRELGVDAYSHSGARTEVEVNGRKLWPVVTGTFGMTDFLHSVVGEVSDKLTQSEVQQLDNRLEGARNDNSTATLKKILNNVPWRLIGVGGGDFGAQADQLQDDANAKELEQKANISQPSRLNNEELQRQALQIAKDIYPILEFHDKVTKAIAEVMDKIPGLSELVENLSGALQIFVFSLLAPYILPILARVKAELAAGSSGVLQASEAGQYRVFDDELCSDPTHSMLSKDHFTNVLNEPAGRVASATVRFVVPLIVEAWDDDSRDPREVIDTILQVLHHPALRDENKEGQRKMFETVREWWESKDEERQEHLKDALSKEGCREGRNHEGEDPNPGPGGKSHNHAGCSHGGAGGYSSGSGRPETHENRTDEDTYGSSRPDETSQDYSRPNEDSYGSNQEYYGGGDSRRNEGSQGYSRPNEDSYGSNQEYYGGGDSRRNEGSQGYSRRNEDSYGSNQEYYGGGDSRRNESSHGYSRRNEDSYGSQRPNYESPSGASRANQEFYGSSRQEPSYGVGDSYGSTRNREPSYGDNETYSSRPHHNQESPYGHGSSRRHEEPHHSRREDGDYARGDNDTSEYGRGDGESHSRNQEEGYGEGEEGHGRRGEGGQYGSERWRRGGEESGYGGRF